MIALAANKSFMRSTFKKALLAYFNLMIVLETSKSFLRLNNNINAFFEF